MKYTLDSVLPINAFKLRGGRSPFAHGMTLEGGGGGFIGDAVSGIAKGATDVVKGVVQPIYNATLKNIPGVDNALVNLDKSVGKAIPGGWGTVASVAASFLPAGSPLLMGLSKTAAATGLGALSGSGVLKKGNQFNLQGAIMGGAMAYGASKLSDAFQNAGRELAATPTGANTAAVEAIKPGSGYVPEGTMPGSPAYTPPVSPTPPPGAGPDYFSGYSPTGSDAVTQAYKPSIGSEIMNGNIRNALNQVGENTVSGIKSLGETALKPFDPATYEGLGTKLADTASGTASNMGDFGSGVSKVLSGSASLPSGIVTGAGIPLVMGAAGTLALEERQKQLDAQKAAGNIAQDQYNAESAKIADQIATANQAVSANPLHATTDISTIAQDPTLYAGRSREDTLYDKNPYGGTQLLYAMGGSVSNPPDDQTNMPNQSPLQNFEHGGAYGLAAGGMPPRFLSGGGDGMSDSIPAMIGNKQEARLADGEFVIPADVVSHLGNGSSKAGAKQLYSMMDKVRAARTGRKSQGKQINPRKYMPV